MKRLPLLLGIALLFGTFGLVGWSMMDQPAELPPRVPVAEAPEEDPAEDTPSLDEQEDPEDVEWPADAPRTIYGDVLDPKGKPIIGATVRIVFDARRPDRKETTNGAGAFRLERVEPDIARFEVEARGYEPQVFEKPDVPAEPRVRWDVVLEPADELFGVVMSGREKAAGAWVAVRAADSPRRFTGRTQADSSGRFTLDWPEGDGPFVVAAFHGQYGPGEVEVIEPGEVKVELEGGGYIQGHVVDGDGEPVPAFSITATPLLRPTGGPPAQSFGSATGAFLLGPLAPGRTRLWAAAEGYQPGELDGIEVVAGETIGGLRIVLGHSTILTGRVTDSSSGQPVEGAQIIPAEWRSNALAESVGAYTGPDGRYSLKALPGVRTSVQVKADGYRPVLIGGVEGQPGETIVRNFQLNRQMSNEVPSQELTGIGAMLGPGPGGVRIRDVVEGGPAAEVLRPGDVVVMVDGVSARGDLARVAQAIRGQVGSDVELMVRRGGSGEPERVMITRDRVVMPDQNHRRVR